MMWRGPIISVAPAGVQPQRCDPPPRWCYDPSGGPPPIPWHFPVCRNGVLYSSRRVAMNTSLRRMPKLMGGCR